VRLGYFKWYPLTAAITAHKNIEEDFLKIVRDNERLIYKVCMFYASDKQPLSDLYQEIVANMWTSFRSFKHNCALSTWIYRIALNTCITGLRKEMRRLKSITIRELHNALPEPESMHEEITEMYRTVNRLGEVERAIVLLYLDDKSYQEIAEITGLTISNVATKLKRAKRKLKDMYNA
jgi:RNA polymerase sigma-70 factor (ECF subfamily)